MWDISLILAAAIVSQPQAATLEGCEFIEQRWVCRYRLPDVQLLTSPPTMPESAPATVPVTVPVTSAAIGQDRGVLTESQIALVARCADAGWMSLCLPSQRTEARRLREESQAYEASRLRVGELLSGNDCDAARAHALSAGYLGLAREAQDFCAAPASSD